ncbi:hypothetical protein pb186bvf_017841 [Paramecium bursaria]
MWTDTLNQEKDKEMQLEYSRIKSQNQKLREELKTINKQLESHIERRKAQSQQKRCSCNKELKDETIKVELNNAQKQLKILQKQISTLQQRQDCLSLDHLASLQSQLKQAQDQNKELQQQNKTLFLINQKQEKKLMEVLQDDFIKGQLDKLDDENKHLKQKLMMKQEKERSLSVAKPEPLLLKPQDNKYIETIKEKDLMIQQLQFKLNQKDKNIQTLSNLKTHYDKQIIMLNSKIKILERQNSELSQLLQQQNYEINRRNMMPPNLSNRMKIKNNRLDISQDEGMQTISNSDVKESKSSQPFRYIRKEEIGLRNEQDSFQDFVDGGKLHNLRVWMDDKTIKGIQAQYFFKGKLIDGSLHSQCQYGDLKCYHTALNESDYIKQIYLGFNGDIIVYIQFSTNLNQFHQYGDKQDTDQKLFNMGELEAFGYMLGSFKNDSLSSLGFQIIRDQVDEQIK